MSRASKAPFRLAYAPAPKTCKETEPACNDTIVPAGSLCLGAKADAEGKFSSRLKWYHWQCGLAKHLRHMREVHHFTSPEDIHGFSDIREEDKRQVRKAWSPVPAAGASPGLTDPAAGASTGLTDPAAGPSPGLTTPKSVQRRNHGRQATTPVMSKFKPEDVTGFADLSVNGKARIWRGYEAGETLERLNELAATLPRKRSAEQEADAPASFKKRRITSTRSPKAFENLQ